MKKLITIVITLFLFAGVAQAMDVRIAWDSNEEPNIVGYKIYYSVEEGAPGTNYNGTGAAEGPSPVTFTLAQDENPDPTITEHTLHDLLRTGIRFAITALDSWGYESDFSVEVSTGVSPPENPRITSIQ